MSPEMWTIYSILGLIGELAEYQFASATDKPAELGDVMWYVSDLASLLSVPLSQVESRVVLTVIIDYNHAISILAGKTKKVFRDHDGTMPQSTYEQILDCLNWCIGFVRRKCLLFCISFEDILQGNADKLKSRMDRGVIQGSGDHR